jgi:hypothetical protein
MELIPGAELIPECATSRNRMTAQYSPSTQTDKTQKKNGTLRVEILTKIISGKAHIFSIFISVSLPTVINASTIYA